jgi:hypothetical protein
VDRALRLPPVGIDGLIFSSAAAVEKSYCAVDRSQHRKYLQTQKDNPPIERTHHPAQGRISRLVGILPAILLTRTAGDDFRPKRQGIMNFTDLDFATVIQFGILPYS